MAKDLESCQIEQKDHYNGPQGAGSHGKPTKYRRTPT